MFGMKVHPSAKKRNTLRSEHAVVSSTSSNAKKLWRVPHVFANVLELPLRSDADVSVEETSHSLRFIASANSLPNCVRAHAIEILPGMTRIVVKGTDGGELMVGQLHLGLDLWRFRLPACTRPAMATAVCTGGKLVVTVPKTGGNWRSVARITEARVCIDCPLFRSFSPIKQFPRPWGQFESIVYAYQST